MAGSCSCRGRCLLCSGCTLVDPYREQMHCRLATRTRVSVIRPLAEIRGVATRARTCSCATSTRAAPTASARATELAGWMSIVEVSDLPALHAFIRGLRKDHTAVVVKLTLSDSDGPSEGVNTEVNF